MLHVFVFVLRHLSFSSSRLLDHDCDELAGRSRRPYSFSSSSSDRLNGWHAENLHASTSDVDSRWRHSSNDSSAGDSRFYHNRLAPSPVQPAAREPLRHSDPHNSSDFIMPPSSNLH